MTLKEKLISISIATAVATGIGMYFNQQAKYLTYRQYKAILRQYNAKIQYIKKHCETDARCYKGRVIFRGLKSKKDVIKRLNNWIKEDNSIYTKVVK